MDTAEVSPRPMIRSTITPSDMVGQGSQYSDDQRREAVALYLRHGVMSVVSRQMAIPERTLHGWHKAEWWDDLEADISASIENELRAGLRRVSLEGTKQALRQLEAGEVKAKDAMIIASIAYDKLRLSLNLPSRISDHSKVDDLAKQLATLSGQVNARVVSEQ